jgi:hypothetical protein
MNHNFQSVVLNNGSVVGGACSKCGQTRGDVLQNGAILPCQVADNPQSKYFNIIF